MIFICVTKKESNCHFWTETIASDNNRLLNSKSKQIVYSVSLLSENQKEAFRTPYLERRAEARGVIRTMLLSHIRHEKSERGRLSSSPTGAKREPYNYVESFDKAAIRHNTILHCEETLANSKYSEFSLGWGSDISRECGD